MTKAKKKPSVVVRKLTLDDLPLVKLKLRPALPTRVSILNTAAELTGISRNKQYGSAVRNMTHFAALLSAYFSTPFSAEDAAQIMVLAKLSRCKANPGLAFHRDNYIDAAAYSAIAGECREAQESL